MSNKFFQTREVLEHCLAFIDGKVIDVGAGNAKYKSLILKKAASYLAFDIVPGKNVDVVGDVLSMPFENGSFDTAISTQVLEHVEKPWIMVKEINRILRPGGICFLSAPFLVSYHPDPTDFFRYTKEGVHSLFKNEGFEIVECGTYGRLFSSIFEIINIGYFKKKRFRGQEKLLKYFQHLAIWLDGFIKNENIFSNVYIVAKKNNL
jgi:SAM-dependent methyltransferase